MPKKKKMLIVIIILVIIILSTVFTIFKAQSASELRTVKSQSQLKRIYNNEQTDIPELLIRIAGMPLSFNFSYNHGIYSTAQSAVNDFATTDPTGMLTPGSINSETISTSKGSGSSKDYSTTNIQVENVDEADIIKTDGDYIYSISDNKVIITDASNPEELKITATIPVNNGAPDDMILYKDKIVIISASSINTNKSSKINTSVEIYDISNKEAPNKVKSYELYEPYYTSRCIGNKLYVMSSGRLRKDNDKIEVRYKEDYREIDLDLKKMYYLKDIKSNTQTIISTVDLDNPTGNVNVQSYLMDISNAYVSENNIYLLDKEYKGFSHGVVPISALFTWKGVFGVPSYLDDLDYGGYETFIYKFKILDDGSIKYDKKTKIEGQTINQFSVDEYNGNLRVALYDDNGSRIVVFNNKLEKIGETSYLAKGEKMYSSRFMGNRAYLVTYRTIDPLYVIDLTEPTTPTVLGELKIPGYSTYLHPYDENHLVGIGMETKENVYRDSYGKVTSTSARIVGMKMALFDVSDVKNPKQISSTVIGDSRTSSSILTNHKALLFSKEKELIAIPVNNYSKDFGINTSSDSYSSMINSYTNYSKDYVSEGYWVYNINLKEGLTLKGTITHNPTSSKYAYYNNSKLLRGLYIDDNLFTVSEDLIQVNDLKDLNIISSLNVRTGKTIQKASDNEQTEEKSLKGNTSNSSISVQNNISANANNIRSQNNMSANSNNTKQ